MSNVYSDRRQFLVTSASIAVGHVLTPRRSAAVNVQAEQTTANNDRPRIGAVGVGGRGTAILKQAAKFGEVVAICDVDSKHAERARQPLAKQQKTSHSSTVSSETPISVPEETRASTR